MMKTISDCDLLDRDQILVSPKEEKISIRLLGNPIGRVVKRGYMLRDGTMGKGTIIPKRLQGTIKKHILVSKRSKCSWMNFPTATSEYKINDVIVIKSATKNSKFVPGVIGHYTINHFMAQGYGTESFVVFSLDRPIDTQETDVEVEFHVYTPSSTYDGITLQSLYSYLAEEWKVSREEEEEDLIQYTFPFTMITREQAILGGVKGAAASSWTFADHNGSNIPPRKLIRTGGWQERDLTGVILAEYAGIMSLGNIPDNLQCSYRWHPNSFPINFARPGPVNEAVRIKNPKFLEILNGIYRADLKSIGVTHLEALVNRFPLGLPNTVNS